MTDWSKSARRKRKLDSIDSDLTQTKITSYYEVLDKIFQLMKKNEYLSELLQSALTDGGKANSKTDSVSVLHQLLANIENVKKNPKHRRHNDIIKKFATVLYIYSGSMAYDYIHKNMPEGLPSL